jgi:hypothetical protein
MFACRALFPKTASHLLERPPAFPRRVEDKRFDDQADIAGHALHCCRAAACRFANRREPTAGERRRAR